MSPDNVWKDCVSELTLCLMKCSMLAFPLPIIIFFFFNYCCIPNYYWPNVVFNEHYLPTTVLAILFFLIIVRSFVREMAVIYWTLHQAKNGHTCSLLGWELMTQRNSRGPIMAISRFSALILVVCFQRYTRFVCMKYKMYFFYRGVFHYIHY